MHDQWRSRGRGGLEGREREGGGQDRTVTRGFHQRTINTHIHTGNAPIRESSSPLLPAPVAPIATVNEAGGTSKETSWRKVSSGWARACLGVCVLSVCGYVGEGVGLRVCVGGCMGPGLCVWECFFGGYFV